MSKGQIEKKVQNQSVDNEGTNRNGHRKKKSNMEKKKDGWKKMPNTKEEGTNRKKKSNMEGINWKKPV